MILKEDFDLALKYLEKVQRLANDSTTSDWMKWRYTTHLLSSFGELWLARGDLSQALSFADRCLERATSTNSRKYIVKGRRLKAEIASARKQFQTAQVEFQKALTLAQFISNPTQLWRTHFAMGKYHLETGRPDKAQESYRAARDVIEGIKAGLQNSNLRNSVQNFSPVKRIYEKNRH